MIKKILIIFLFLIFFMPPEAQAVKADNGKLIKVGISDNSFANYYVSSAKISATDEFRVVDKTSGTEIGVFQADKIIAVDIKDNLFFIKDEENVIAENIKGPVVFSSDKGFLYVDGLKRAGKQALYRGTFELTKVETKKNLFSIINILDLTSYLRGVVPNEMPSYFGLEALKAQTVTARNYVLRPRDKNFYNFDVCDSVACQVYFGANTEDELADEAILETNNIVALYNGELILALYSSTAGGYTESYENAFSDPGTKNFPAVSLPYLKGVPDNKSFLPLTKEEDAAKFYKSEPSTFDNKSSYFRWTKEWTQQELSDSLKQNLKKQSATGFVFPALKNEEDFGLVQDIQVTKRGVSGKIVFMNIVTDKGVYTVQKELVIRRSFCKDGKALPSANVVFEFQKDDEGNIEKITAYGGGYGHGVGMSQWGAGMMNSLGYSYDEILQHYYSGVSIGTYPVTLTNNPNQDTASQSFYTKNKKASLIIENKFQFTDLIVVINAQELKLEISPHLFNKVKVDLSPYLVSGINNITYIMPYRDTNNKSIKMHVELKEAVNE